MNKAELIVKVAAEAGLTKVQAKKFLDFTIENIIKSVKRGDDVKLIGFGTFEKTKRKARQGRHPLTGREINIPATWSPRFRPGREFKNLIRS